MTNEQNHPGHTSTPAFGGNAAYWQLFTDSVDALVITDGSGTVLQANPSAATLYARKDLPGLEITTLLTGNEVPAPDALQDGSLRRFDATVTRPNGEARSVRVHARLVDGSQEALLQWIHHDVTERLRADDAREDLTAMLVHDLQGPLGNVIMSLEMVREALPEVEPRFLREMVDIAFRSSQHLHTLVQSLLDMSRLQAGYPLTHRDPLEVHDLVHYVYDVEQPSLQERRVGFERDIPEGLPALLAEENVLRRVLLNLLDNALKHSRAGDTITVSAREDADAGAIVFAVSDQGIGVPAAYRELIFEKFQRVQTTPGSQGLGLGLAFCRLAVEAHGGRIWVEDAPGGGARFYFTIPTATSA